MALLLGLLSPVMAYAATPRSPEPTALVTLSGGVQARVTASSTLKSKPPGRYDVKHAFDGDEATAWVEGGPGTDEASLLVSPNEVLKLWGLVLRPGYTKSLTTLRQNTVPENMVLYHLDSTDEEGLGRLLSRLPLYYRLSLVGSRRQKRCGVLAKDPVNLSPKLVLYPLPNEVEAFWILVEPLPTSAHRPKYADLAVSEVLPLFDIVDVEHKEIVEIPPSLAPPLRDVVGLLRRYGDVRLKTPEQLPLEEGARVSSFFEATPEGLPDWAREALRAKLLEQGADPAQDAPTQFGKAVAEQFYDSAITVQKLSDGGMRLIGEPFSLRREVPGPPARVEQAFVFPVLMLNAAFRVTNIELKTSGLSGAGCEQSLPPL